MSPAPAASIISLSRWQPHQEARPAPTGCYAFVARLLCFDHDRNAFTSRNCRALLSPGDPYSVVFPVNLPPNLAAVYDVVNFGAPLSWCGIACRLVRVRIGLPVAGSETPRPFSCWLCSRSATSKTYPRSSDSAPSSSTPTGRAWNYRRRRARANS